MIYCPHTFFCSFFSLSSASVCSYSVVDFLNFILLCFISCRDYGTHFIAGCICVTVCDKSCESYVGILLSVGDKKTSKETKEVNKRISAGFNSSLRIKGLNKYFISHDTWCFHGFSFKIKVCNPAAVCLIWVLIGRVWICASALPTLNL